MDAEAPSLLRAFLDSIQPVVLVGGKSRRFGRDKLMEPWGGKLLVQHPINALREVFGARVKVVGACDPRVPALADGVIPDIYAGAGPIGGIASALDFWNGPVFVLAGDMPAVSRTDILEIAAAAERNQWAAAVVGLTDRLHSCYGVYRAAARPLLRSRLESGESRLSDALPARLVLPVAVSQNSAENVNYQNTATGI